MKILMVCLGNICRSPMADGLLRKKVKDNNLDVEVDSAGTGGWHAGESPDPRMQKTAAKNGVPIHELVARQFQVSDFDTFDRIYVMDRSNYTNVLKLARNDKDKEKVDLLLNLSFPGEDREVPDPYFGGQDGFQEVFEMLDDATTILINELEENGNR
ncbi:MAG: low molecular weight phosphotyrosine protein phosphatase [Brumimicrobium sp.]|nr:low molecular weight phosphotyrosine protein phosphatase [Brumimicrobium sp.]MCO5267927.1 low molecular weight phosphotyrosine protein phosphatase [Brumimicrobium sp.]